MWILLYMRVGCFPNPSLPKKLVIFDNSATTEIIGRMVEAIALKRKFFGKFL
jgi:hypothetical protein